MLARLQVTRPKLYHRILELMSPDEALHGKDFMPELPKHTIIVMKDKNKKNNTVQTKITKYFRRLRPL